MQNNYFGVNLLMNSKLKINLIFSITRRILNCTRKINIPALRKFCIEANIHYCESFSSDLINLTGVLHRAWAHMVIAIEENDGYGLGLITGIHISKPFI